MSSSSFWRWRRPGFDTSKRPETPSPATGSSAEALSSLFGDEEVSDVILEGHDGGTVMAVKAILAARSPMFRHKFFGSSSFIPSKPNEKEHVVFNEWDCRILHLVVEYCYTDNCSAMRGVPTEDTARVLATLRVAAKAFKLPYLLDKIRQWVWRQVTRHPALACAMVDEGMRNDDVDELALQTLQLKTRAALLPNQNAVGSGVLALSKPGLLFVLRTLDETTSHYLLLQAIDRWVDFSSEDCSGDNPSRERASREAFGRKCAMRFIKLSKIPQENLDAVIKRSELYGAQNSFVTSIIPNGFRAASTTSLNTDSYDKPSPERSLSSPSRTFDSYDSYRSMGTPQSRSSTSSPDEATSPRDAGTTLSPIQSMNLDQ
mmetsp:Transcript_19200/g.24199  ORF Transcript_19200/g.24199 Transcript_19200/m.24199 type:complete len:374 (+) Transcript_19200:97-1218(+)|eukprot:CAMPEP_0203674956 /NCGR_PEP_ID=MMETSP0090-20130426/18130_1 /ASSEMBLY_ACC=CAM_ASM_001088 /TAXON_ID=426623 /ORGANISM="Chaetoceros affinis, Strain CCMP159" /LENGTH=373 /DNA_ID=CAMNT_0050540977 /DNA_START=55 /DNA_END=1176 /DNA_ORIENTATION=-